jgi:hypothetical protein
MPASPTRKSRYGRTNSAEEHRDIAADGQRQSHEDENTRLSDLDHCPLSCRSLSFVISGERTETFLKTR